MPARLSETYQQGDQVEIVFEVGGEERWFPGRVIAQQHPGLWVRTNDGSTWFVTNTRRIRRLTRSETGQSDEFLARSETGQSDEFLAQSETGQSDEF